VSEDDGGVPTPLILDVSVLIEIARGDTDIMTLIQDYDAAGQPMVVPALAVTAASIDIHGEEAADLLGSFELLCNLGAVGRVGLEPTTGGL
jgi:hypothetical protein